MPGVTYSCLYDVLFKGPQPDDMIAVRDRGRKPLTMGRLRQHVTETVGRLNAMGFQRNDRLAVAMPSGPEMFVTFMSVASGFTFVPLNPYYSTKEYEGYLADLSAKALIVLDGSDSRAESAARSLGIRIIGVHPRLDLEAGLFSLAEEYAGAVSAPSFARPEDLAMILFTAGTTSKPKMVPFTHERLCLFISIFAEKNIRQYNPGVCNVCFMPMFHLQGLIFPISTLAVNVSVACAPALSVPLFIEYITEFHPAWCSAGPPVLQGLLDYADNNPSFSLPKSISHFISSGAPLSPQLAKAFEARLGTPVVNGYWMSESMMITNNSPSQSRAKPGSVGTRGNSEIRFVSDGGAFLKPGEAGEIVLRGPLVITGYLNNPEENAASFLDGWFRTGDMGYIDGDGYLFITGRSQERINMGGEKVSPGEIEEILLTHPAVSSAVVFPVPDPVLGETVGAAVVLKRGMEARPGDLKRHVSTRLAYFKVPAQIWIVDSIPLGSTGKVRRIGLYEKLKGSGVLAERPGAIDYDLPATPAEKALAGIWSEVLAVDTICRDDSFFEIGGDSLKAARLITLIEDKLKVTLPLGAVITAPTLSQMANALGSGQQNRTPRHLVALQPDGARPPVYCFPTVHGTLSEYYALARDIGTDQPVYGFISPGLDGSGRTPSTVEAAARLYIGEMRSHQSRGPYHLLGFCAGSLIAHEVACQLEADGDEVGFLGVVDYQAPGEAMNSPLWSGYRYFMDNAGGTALHFKKFMRADARGRVRTLARAPGFLAKKTLHLPGEVVSDPALAETLPASASKYQQWLENLPEPQRSVGKANTDAIRCYVPKSYGGDVTVFMSSARVKSDKRAGKYEAKYGWNRVAKGRVRLHVIDGNHVTIMKPECSKVIARIIREEIRRCHPVNASRR